MSIQKKITCPKCGLTSHNSADVAAMYCGECGYHNAPVDAPIGVPGVSAKWRQPTPVMQMRLVCSTLEANFLNWQDGISSDKEFEEIFRRSISDLNKLYSHVETTGHSDRW